MNTNGKTSETRDRKAILSMLWIFAVFNYLYGDVAMMIFHPATYQKIASRMSDGAVLGAAALMEIPMAMVFLSWILKYRANRWANIIAGAESTAFVVFTLLGGRPPVLYVFLSAIEIACTVFIVWYAWTWRDPGLSLRN